MRRPRYHHSIASIPNVNPSSTAEAGSGDENRRAGRDDAVGDLDLDHAGADGQKRVGVGQHVDVSAQFVLSLAWIVLGESLTVGRGIGFVLVLAGSVLATRVGRVADASSGPVLEPAANER